MTRKAEFNAEEWTTLVEGPVFAGMRVTKASHGGTIRESMAMGKLYAHAREQHGEDELLDDLVASPPALDTGRLGSGADFDQLSAQRLRDAVALLKEKATPEELEAYGRFVLSLAEAAAQAHKEGGFAGIGGERVSPEEQAALDEIGTILRS